MVSKHPVKSELDWKKLAQFDVGGAFMRWLRGKPLFQVSIGISLFFCYGFAHTWTGLNGNRQWAWNYHGGLYLDDYLPGTVFWLLPGIAGACAVWLWLRRLAPVPRRRSGLALLMAWGCYYHAAAWWTMFHLGPAMLGGSMLSGVATGFTAAAFDIDRGKLPPLPELLAHFPDHVSKMSMHPKTHPPGNILLSYGAARLLERHPGLEAGLHRAFGALGVRYDNRLLEGYSSLEQTVGMLMGLLAVGAGLAAALPLFALVRRASGDERAAWFAAALWIHYPALICMTPSYDQLYALIALASLWAWRRGFDGRPALWGAIAGLIGALGCLVSYKILLWLPLFVPMLLLDLRREAGSLRPAAVLAALRSRRAYARARLALGLAAMFAFGGSILLLKPVAGIDLIGNFIAACRIQAVLTADLQRTYWLWFFYGPYDVLVLAGPMLSTLALATWFGCLRNARRGLAVCDPAFAFFPVGLLLITLSGTVLGENARQLLMFGPGICWAAALWLRRGGAGQDAMSLAATLIAQHFFTAICINYMDFIGRY